MDEPNANGVEAAESTSPRSELSPPPSTWTIQQEQQAQEEYQQELADYYLYELVRQFASAARRLALYDCRTCLKELERLPVCHQRSTSVLIMVGKVHYELQDYTSVSGFTFSIALSLTLPCGISIGGEGL